MTLHPSLEQKILILILKERGISVDEQTLADFFDNSALIEKISHAVEAIDTQSTALNAPLANDQRPTPDEVHCPADTSLKQEASEMCVGASQPCTEKQDEEGPLTVNTEKAKPALPAANPSALKLEDTPAGQEDAVEISSVVENTASSSVAENLISNAPDTRIFSETPPGDAPLYQLMDFQKFELSTDSENVHEREDQLRPGQVPSLKQKEQAVPVLPPPSAKVSLSNARAGDLFFSPVTIALDNGQPAEVTNIIFPQDIGLYFDKEHHALTGSPTESGDFDITVLWSSQSCPEGQTKILFVVNPNPRSLWKVIEPPSEAPYPKAHVDYKGICNERVRIAAASRRGRSHEHVGSFRDDDFYINHSDDSGWSVMLVADGAGSAVNSRQGSHIATATAGEYLFSQFKGSQGLALKKLIINWAAEDKAATSNTMLHHFKMAAKIAINSIENESIHSGQNLKSYSTTLLATVSFREGEELFAASFWLGDGAIAAYSTAGTVRVLGQPDSGEYAGQTRFLDKDIIDDPAFTRRISIGKWNDVSHLILMTDGVSDPRFETDNGLKDYTKWQDLVADLSPCLVEEAQAPVRLAEWLNFFSTGNHDDRTIVVSW